MIPPSSSMILIEAASPITSAPAVTFEAPSIITATYSLAPIRLAKAATTEMARNTAAISLMYQGRPSAPVPARYEQTAITTIPSAKAPMMILSERRIRYSDRSLLSPSAAPRRSGRASAVRAT